MDIFLRPTLGLYFHIPYCLQRCHYCDFATVLRTHKIPPEAYFELLYRELDHHGEFMNRHRIKTIYFGGGTPSAVDPELIIALLQQLSKRGFTQEVEEITYEVDPATIDQSQLDRMIESGVQRFSVGLQSLNAQHLARIGRRHTPADGHQLLGWLRERRATFSVDVLFSLPEQKTEDLDADLAQILGYEPDHVSPYYLTLKSTHPLNRGRPSEDQDVDLMDLVESRLLAAGYLRYEISNYAKPGKEARHNRLYWTDQAYLGLGMSAHSYDPRRGPWGTRWSNDKTMVGYQSQVDNSRTHSLIEELQWEEALTDFCHTSFRRCEGLIWAEVETKFGSLGPRSPVPKIREVAAQVAERGLVQVDSMGARLTAAGRKLVDPVLLEFTFLPAR